MYDDYGALDMVVRCWRYYRRRSMSDILDYLNFGSDRCAPRRYSAVVTRRLPGAWSDNISILHVPVPTVSLFPSMDISPGEDGAEPFRI